MSTRAYRQTLKADLIALSERAEELGELATAGTLLVLAASLCRETDRALYEHTKVFAQAELRAIEARRN